MSTWVGFDLDGTLAYYDTWRGEDHIGPPIPAMIMRLRYELDAGHKCKIVTARAGLGQHAVDEIHTWLEDQGFPPLEVTDRKDFGMIKLYDDRAIGVVTNTGRIIRGDKRKG